MSTHYHFDLLKQKKLPLILLQEHCEASAYKDLRKPSGPFWFKDLNIVFKHVQRANTENTVLVDDSPMKNLLNDPLNGLHPPPFEGENPSSHVHYLMTTMLPYLLRMKSDGTHVRSFTARNALPLSTPREMRDNALGMTILSNFKRSLWPKEQERPTFWKTCTYARHGKSQMEEYWWVLHWRGRLKMI